MSCTKSVLAACVVVASQFSQAEAAASWVVVCKGFPASSNVRNIEIDYAAENAYIITTTGVNAAVPLKSDELLDDEPPVRRSTFEGKISSVGLTQITYTERLSKGSMRVVFRKGSDNEIKLSTRDCKKVDVPAAPVLDVPARSNREGSQCGLIDDADQLDKYRKRAAEFSRGEEKKVTAAVSRMSKMDRTRILFTARWLAKELGEERQFKSANAAALYLLDQGGFADLASTLSIQGQQYTMVRAYPGDTATGLIFKHNSQEPIAEIHDSDVVCRQ